MHHTSLVYSTVHCYRLSGIYIYPIPGTCRLKRRREATGVTDYFGAAYVLLQQYVLLFLLGTYCYCLRHTARTAWDMLLLLGTTVTAWDLLPQLGTYCYCLRPNATAWDRRGKTAPAPCRALRSSR